MARSRHIGLNPNAAVGEIEAAKGHEDIFAVEHPEQIGALHYKANAASLGRMEYARLHLTDALRSLFAAHNAELANIVACHQLLRAMSAPPSVREKGRRRPTLHCAVPVAAALFCLLLFFDSLFDLLDGLLNSGLRLKLLCDLLSVRGCLLGIFFATWAAMRSRAASIFARSSSFFFSANTGFTPSAACARGPQRPERLGR